MPYKFAPIHVDLSEFGDGLFARCLHPRLQPYAATRRQKLAMASMAVKLGPRFDELAGKRPEDIPVDLRAQILEAAGGSLDVADELVRSLVIEWNVPDPYSGEVLKLPREDPSSLDRCPGPIADKIASVLQAALAEGADPNS